jgi:hypothetical protein
MASLMVGGGEVSRWSCLDLRPTRASEYGCFIRGSKVATTRVSRIRGTHVRNIEWRHKDGALKGKAGTKQTNSTLR